MDSGEVPMIDAGVDSGSAEICGNGFDDDGDGLIDQGCTCLAGTTQFCFPGTPEQALRGTCRVGSQACIAGGEFSSWGACVGAVAPSEDLCGDALDQDCSGIADDGPACCVGSSTEVCYDGAPGSSGVGACHAGLRTCASGVFGACAGQALPGVEVCANGVDDDCDALTDEGCVCTPSTSRSCYPYDAAQIGRGLCRAGTDTCNAAGSGYDGCTGFVGPTAEVCGNGVDDNCDGGVDEGCFTCAPGPVSWVISAAEMASGASDRTGAGLCSGTAYCSGTTCYTTPPGGCGAGVPHCATLTYGDGRTHTNYCSVRATCTAGGIVATGFTW